MHKCKLYILVFFFLLSGCEAKYVSQKTKSIEIGSAINLDDLVEYDDNVNVNYAEDFKNPTSLGDYKIDFLAKKDDKLKVYTFTFKIVDTTKPLIEQTADVYIRLNDRLNIKNCIKVSDNSGEEILDKVKIAEYSTSEIGSFSVKLSVSDSSGNEADFQLPYQVIVPVESIDLHMSEATINVGKTLSLNASIKPDNASIRSVVWYSSRPEIASVSNEGIINGISEGSAIITAKSVDGFSQVSINVTVKKTTTPLVDMKKRLMSFDEYYYGEGINWTETQYYSSNSVGSVTGAIAFINNSGKTINYITLTYHLYNAVGDPALEDITGLNYIKVRWIGPVEPFGRFDATGDSNIIGYCSTCSYVNIKEVKIEYSGGTSENGILNVKFYRY